jgi:DNA-binding NarL/FixJ family response regulator
MANPTKQPGARVFLVDDHPMVREHLAALLHREPDLVVCGEAEDAPEALARIGKLKPDLVIMDISLKQSHGLELLKDLKSQFPKIPVLVLSMHEESLYADRVLGAGAMGYITKQQATRNILSAVRKVLAGQVYLSEQMSERMMRKLVGKAADKVSLTPESLTDREVEVLQMIGRGCGTRRIAEDLRIGIKTVESYRARIKEKLNLSSGDQLLQYAIQWLQDHPSRSS